MTVLNHTNLTNLNLDRQIYYYTVTQKDLPINSLKS